MSNVRIYIRSIHRAIINQWTILINIKNSFQDMFQIVSKKEKLNQAVNLTKEKFERRREIINSGDSASQSKIINFVR